MLSDYNKASNNPLKDLMEKAFINSKLNFKLSANLSNNFIDGELKIDVEQITSDDLSILSSFLDSKDAQLYILKLTVFKNLAQLTERGMRQPSRIITASASKVCRVCVDFIGRSRSLVEVVFGGLVFTIEGMNRLGSAISRTKSHIHVFALKSCSVGDTGFGVLAPHLFNSLIQVVQIERCGLTEASNPHIEKLIKMQGEMMDSVFWNATLRLTRQNDCEDIKNSIMNRGIIVLSFEGNALSGAHMYNVARALGTNHWLVGLNFAYNGLQVNEVRDLVTQGLSSSLLIAMRIDGNPGYSDKIASVLDGGLSHAQVNLDVLSKSTQDVLISWLRHSDASALTEVARRSIARDEASSQELVRKISQATRVERVEAGVPISPMFVEEVFAGDRALWREWGSIDRSALTSSDWRPSSRRSTRVRAFIDEPLIKRTNTRSKSAPSSRHFTAPSFETAQARLPSSENGFVRKKKSSRVLPASESPARERVTVKKKSGEVRELRKAVDSITENLQTITEQLTHVSQSLMESAELQRGLSMNASFSRQQLHNSSITYTGGRSPNASRSNVLNDSTGTNRSLDEEDDVILTELIQLSLRGKLDEFARNSSANRDVG